MSSHRIVIKTPLSAAEVASKLRVTSGRKEMLLALADAIVGIASGNLTAEVRMIGNDAVASGTVSFASHVQNDTVTINGVVLTCRNAPATAVQYLVGADDEAMANNFRAFINASATANIVGEVVATRSGTVTLAAFADTDTVVVNGVTFTGKTTPNACVREEFAIGADDTATAANLAKAINASLHGNLIGLVSATAAAGVLTVVYDGALTMVGGAHATVANATVILSAIQPGTIGNLSSLAISAHGAVSGANMTGGLNGTQYIFSNM